MQAYKYDEKTKEYTGVQTAQIDPLESTLQGKEIYLLPANATFEKPNLQEGFAPVWNGEKWENIEDNRGKEYWLNTDEYGTPAREMKELGPFPAGSVFTAPEKTIDELKQDKIQELKSERDQLEVEPIDNFDADEKSIMRINTAIGVMDVTKTPIEWTMSDNTTKEVTADDLRNVIVKIGIRSNQLHESYRVAKEKVNAATTKEEVEAVKLEV